MLLYLNHFSCAYSLNSSKLEPLSPERHGPSLGEEETVRVQKKSGKSGQCLCLLLVIFAIIASKLPQFYSNFSRCACCSSSLSLLRKMMVSAKVCLQNSHLAKTVHIVCNSARCS